MDSLIGAAAHALAAGDPLGALKRVALRDDPPALALRGIAMAQIGDFARAKALLRTAAKGFGARAPVARARCIVAEAEIALAARDLDWPARTVEAARATLAAHGDRLNAAHAGNLEIRRLLLIGRLDEAERRLAGVDPGPLPAALRANHELAVAGIAIRRLQTAEAQAAILRAAEAAHRAGIPALRAEVDGVAEWLRVPAARLIRQGEARAVTLDGVEAALKSAALVIDACRNTLHAGGTAIGLATRPVLFALLRVLAEAWPGDAARQALIARAFRARHVDESHRARLRVEIGRLRAGIAAVAEIEATPGGFRLLPLAGREVVVLAPLAEEQNASLLALLADGESWPSSALAIALGTSARTVQRGLEQLAAAGKVQSIGHGRARRWMMPPVPGFPTALLLPGPLPGD
ncbi:MAG TPA: helix-turn-helix domain-containing protein [Devosia sp.]|nr:helix-turn-helix domain-containing protein [Devosia sp.]